MAETVPHKLQIWDGWSSEQPTVVPEGVRAEILPLADQFARQEVFQPSGRLQLEGEPFTLPWFQGIERRRFGRHGRWIPHLLGFHKHEGESVLAIGGALGTDWVQYAQHGADVQVLATAPGPVQAMQRHFAERKLKARLGLLREPTFPIDNASIDVLVFNFVDSPLISLPQMSSEAYRVLRPGGKIILLGRARWDLDAWWGWLPWFRHLGPRSVVDAHDLVRINARQVRQVFANFTESRISRRHLRRAELPHLFRPLPLGLLERIFGRVMVFKGFKPISSALPYPIAA